MVKGRPGRAANGNFALSDVKLTAAALSGGKAVAVKLVKPRADVLSSAPAGRRHQSMPTPPRRGRSTRSFGKDHAAVYELAEPISNEGGTALMTFTLSFNGNTGHNFGRVRLSVSESATARWLRVRACLLTCSRPRPARRRQGA